MLTETNPNVSEQTSANPDPREYWQGFPEAPYSDSFKWIDDKGFEHLSTVRGWSFMSMLSSITKAEQVILDMGGKGVISKDNRPEARATEQAPTTGNTKIPLKMEDGTPVVDGNTNEPVMVDLPAGHHLFTVKEVFRDKNGKGDKYMLKVVLEEPYEFGNGKWGISYFKPDGAYAGWTKWELQKRYRPDPKWTKVIVKDPEPGSKFANIVEFRPE